MLQRIEETIKGIGAAIKKGMSRRFKNEKEATERKNEVSDILTRLDTVKDRLMKLREALGFIRKC
jgi:Mg2+ and Co2+ transporter CorA